MKSVRVEYSAEHGSVTPARRRGAAGASPAREITLTVEDLAGDLVEHVRDALAAAHQLRTVSERLGTGLDETLAALTALALDAAPAGDPASSLGEQDEAVLREAGSLAVQAPPLERRPSLASAVAGLGLLAGALTTRQAAQRLGVTEGRVRQRITARTLLGLQAAGGWRLPDFQFTADGLVPGLDEVLPALPSDVHPLVVQHFLHAPTPELEVRGRVLSPRDWLSGGGDVAVVVSLATALHAMP